MLNLFVRDKVGVLESSGLLTSGISALIPGQSLSNSFPHNYLSGILVRIFQIVECRFRTSTWNIDRGLPIYLECSCCFSLWNVGYLVGRDERPWCAGIYGVGSYLSGILGFYFIKHIQLPRTLQMPARNGHGQSNCRGNLFLSRLCSPLFDHHRKNGPPLVEHGYLFTRTGLTASVLPGWDNLSSRCTP